MKKPAATSPNAKFLAIDPGNSQSGWVFGRAAPRLLGGFELLEFGIEDNADLRKRLGYFRPQQHRLLLETPKPQGMPASGETMETLIAIGRFIQEWSRRGGRWGFVFRPAIKLHLCGTATARDANVNQAIKDRFGGEQRGIRCPVCKGKGWKGPKRPVCTACHGHKWAKRPGPLYGVTSHAFAAMGVALWWVDHQKVQQMILNPGGKDPRVAAIAIRKSQAKRGRKGRPSRTLGH